MFYKSFLCIMPKNMNETNSKTPKHASETGLSTERATRRARDYRRNFWWGDSSFKGDSIHSDQAAFVGLTVYHPWQPSYHHQSDRKSTMAFQSQSQNPPNRHRILSCSLSQRKMANL